MAKTVAEVLAAADDSVNLINSINTDGADSTYLPSDFNQDDINDTVQRNVEHLELILAYAPVDDDDDTPDVAGSSDDKSSYTDAIATGKAYIAAN